MEWLPESLFLLLRLQHWLLVALVLQHILKTNNFAKRRNGFILKPSKNMMQLSKHLKKKLKRQKSVWITCKA